MYFLDIEKEKICNYDLEFSLPKINGIEKKITYVLGEKNANTVDEYFGIKAENIFLDYIKKMKSSSVSPTRHVYFEQLYPILKTKKIIVFKHSYQFQENQFEHPKNNLRLLNYFSDEDKIMIFENVFDEKSKNNLIKLVYNAIKSKLGIDDVEIEIYWKVENFSFEQNKAYVYENFAILEDGILFEFYPSSVQALAFGVTCVFIPKKEIKSCVKKDFIIKMNW